MRDGWFAVRRGITQHPLFKGKPQRLVIWLWLVDNACFKDTQHDINGKTVTVKRGQVCASQKRISEECCVDRQVVRTFLKRLSVEGMINPDLTNGRTIITVCNYDTYQHSEKTPNPTPNQRLTSDKPTKGNVDTSVSKDTGEKPSPSADPKKIVFDAGVELLTASGKSGSAARGIIGKWVKAHGVGSVIDALSAAKSQGVIEPIAWIEGRWKTKTSHIDSDGAILNHGLRLRKIRPPVQPREREPCRA